MSNDNGSDFFKDIQPNILELKKHLQSINDNLSHEEIEQFSSEKGSGSLRMQFEKNPKGVGGFDQIEHFIMESIEIVDKLDQYRSHSTLALEHSRAQRKVERLDMWVLWLQRLVRWSLGIIVAVVLYSSIVWASKQCDFIKIPIKDWL